MKPTHVLFYLLCFFISYSQALKVDVGPAQVSVPYFLAIAGIMFVLLKRIIRHIPNQKWVFPVYWPALVFVLVYFAIGGLAIIGLELDDVARNSDSLFRIVEQLVRLLFSFIILIFVADVSTDRRVMMRGIKVMVLSSGLVGLYGIYQVVGTFSGFYRPLLPNTAAYGVAKGVQGASRAVGMMREPSYLAGFLCFSILMTLMLLIGNDNIRGKLRSMLWLSLGIQFLCLVLTTSSIGFMGVAVSIIALQFVLDRRSRQKMLAVLLVVAVMISIPIANIAARSNLSKKLVLSTVGKAEQVSAVERTEFVVAALKMFSDHPVIGVGPGLYNSYIRDYSSAFYIGRGLIANNVYAELLSETGIIGFISFAVLFIGLLRMAVKNRHSAPDKLISTCLTVSLMALSVEFLAYPTFKMEFIWFMFGLTIALSGNRLPSKNILPEKPSA